jgi:hypothetical protein
LNERPEFVKASEVVYALALRCTGPSNDTVRFELKFFTEKVSHVRAINRNRNPGLCAWVLGVGTCYVVPAIGQECPRGDAIGPTTASAVRALEGTLVFHDSIRKWFELRLRQPQCGQTSIELVPGSLNNRTPLEVFKGCRVRTKGPIDFSPTGYYSLDTYQSVDRVEPVGACAKQAPFPDYSKANPNKDIQEYRVDMHVDYEAGDHPITFRVSSRGKQLQPWQAYAGYVFTGGFVLRGYCGTGFVIADVFGTPQAKPSHFTEPGDSQDAAEFDPETAAAAGKKDLQLGYTCVRKSQQD